jgi:hypothetical protein
MVKFFFFSILFGYHLFDMKNYDFYIIFFQFILQHDISVMILGEHGNNLLWLNDGQQATRKYLPIPVLCNKNKQSQN